MFKIAAAVLYLLLICGHMSFYLYWLLLSACVYFFLWTTSVLTERTRRIPLLWTKWSECIKCGGNDCIEIEDYIFTKWNVFPINMLIKACNVLGFFKIWNFFLIFRSFMNFTRRRTNFWGIFLITITNRLGSTGAAQLETWK